MSFWGKNQTRKENQIRSLTVRIVLIFFVVIAAAIGTVTYTITAKSAQEVKNKVVKLLRMNNRQQIYNLNLYLSRVEDTGDLLFSDDVYCDYNAAEPGQDEFEKIRNKAEVEDRLQDLGVLQNFSDFGIVYSDDSSIGWISNTTIKLFPDGGLYQYLDGHVGDDGTESGWFFDYDRCYDRLYYVKRLNDNAILTAAFYSGELSATFSNLDDVRGLETYVIDDNNVIIYADDTELLGKDADTLSVSLQSTYSDYQVVTDEMVVIGGTCENGWRVVCMAPADVLFLEEQQFVKYSLIITAVMLIFVFGSGILLFTQMARKQDSAFSDIQKKADHDALTQFLNKQSHREFVDPKLGTDIGYMPDMRVFLMIDIDNFKKVNDTYGHREGDRVLREAAQIFKAALGPDMEIGRVGGDEFAVYADYAGSSGEKIRQTVETAVRAMQKQFREKFRDRYKTAGISVSVGGCAVSGERDVSYDELYQMADQALYESKRGGKDRFRWYSDSEELPEGDARLSQR